MTICVLFYLHLLWRSDLSYTKVKRNKCCAFKNSGIISYDGYIGSVYVYICISFYLHLLCVSDISYTESNCAFQISRNTSYDGYVESVCVYMACFIYISCGSVIYQTLKVKKKVLLVFFHSDINFI